MISRKGASDPNSSTTSNVVRAINGAVGGC